MKIAPEILRDQIITDIRDTLPNGTYNVSFKQLAVFVNTTEKNVRTQIEAGTFPCEIVSFGARKYVTITVLTNYFVDLILHEGEIKKRGQPVKALAMAKKMAENGRKFLQTKGDLK
jgi:hypothetical protein